MAALGEPSPTTKLAAWRFARAVRRISRRWCRSPAHPIGVLAAAGAIVTAIVLAAGTELASSANADGFATATASPSASVSGVADETSASHYLDTINTVDKDFESNLQSLATAVQNQDWGGAKTACQTVSGSAQALKATLPSPDSRVTPRVRQAADNITTAYGRCSQFGPAMVQDDWDQFMTSVNNARSDLISAASILQHPR